MKLQGKRAVITGAASGIGRAAALAFAAEGASIVLCDVARGVHDVAAEVSNAGGSAVAVMVDVSDEQQVQGLVATSVESFGGLEIMFANAGVVNSVAPVVELTERDWRSVLNVNVMGTFFCLKHALLHMLDHDVAGSVLCTASVAGLRAGGGPAHYSASKAAVISLVQTAACQLAGTSIRVNAICPGLIETGMTKPIFDMARNAGKAHKIGQLNPLKRAGRPEEIAKIAVMLASDDASYINGEAIVVDGGLSASLPTVPGKLW
jgi:NAD(P)-dependent dehydrogenase (short-subunit alcohol dehydrogenase family)